MRSGEASREATVGLTLPNGKPYPLAGDIDYVSADVAQGTDTIMLRAVFDNPDGTLLDGALVGVSLEQRQPEQVLTVPQQAVQRDQGGAFVLVVGADGKVELRRVQVARNDLGLAVVGGRPRRGRERHRRGRQQGASRHRRRRRRGDRRLRRCSRTSSSAGRGSRPSSRSS